MGHKQQGFLRDSAEKATDLDLRKKINHALYQSDVAFSNGKQQFSDLAFARELANSVKWEAINHLDKYLEQFETAFSKRGGKVIYAEDADQALEAIMKICEEKKARSIVKSKSMVTEEIHLNDFLLKQGINIIETDLGEYIQQLAEEPPYHIVAPSMHKSREEVAQLFNEKLNSAPNLDPEQLTRVARNELRHKFKEAEIGITGANFILADVGGIVVTENEGNARLSSSFPKTHIVITGIEKVLPSINDLHLFLPLLATHGSGQRITVYNSIFTGPKQPDEIDGPEEMYVILLDNGRTDILADPKARQSLYCIRCGACLNVCPVFRNIGGHSYNATYSGPIGSVITPYLKGLQDYKHLSYASTLCGSCTEICPVRIDLHELLLDNREKAVVVGMGNKIEKVYWYFWGKTILHRGLIDLFGGKFKNMSISTFFKRTWGDKRSLPVFSSKSFSKQWKQQSKKKA